MSYIVAHISPTPTVLQSMVFCGMCYISTTAAGVGLKYNTAAKGGEGHACVYGVHSGWLVCTSPRLLPRSTAIGQNINVQYKNGGNFIAPSIVE